MNTSNIPNFVYSMLQKHENNVKKMKLQQLIKRKERSIKYTESPIVRHRIKNDIKIVKQKVNEIDDQINIYK